jgi:hypothetical protein
MEAQPMANDLTPTLSQWKHFQRHPLSELFPDMGDEDFAAFSADMAKDGYDHRQQILLYEGKVLDGWQRHRAAVAANKMPTFENYKGDNPLAEVIRRNLSRRHLNESQRAMVAATLSEKRYRGEKNSSGLPIGTTSEPSYSECARMLNVSATSVKRAEKVYSKGTTELNRAVMAGDLSVSDAAAVSGEPPEVQNAAVQAVKKGEAKTAAAAAKKPKLQSTVRKKKKTLHEAVTEDLAKEEDAEPKTIEEEISAKNSVLEKYCRDLMKFVDTMPDDPWLSHDDRRKSAIQKIKDACETIRSAKCYRACPMCKGEGCKDCHKSGRVTKYAYQQLV